LARNQTIDATDLDLLTVTDSPDEAIEALKAGVAVWRGRPRRPHKHKVLGEKGWNGGNR
jgi:hypothetical protein